MKINKKGKKTSTRTKMLMTKVIKMTKQRRRRRRQRWFGLLFVISFGVMYALMIVKVLHKATSMPYV